MTAGEQPAATTATTPVAFSLVQGGPTYRLARALHLVHDDHRLWLLGIVVVILTWVPLVALGIPARTESLLGDYAVHVRFLVTIPLFLAAERSLHVRTGRCLEIFTGERWAKDGDAAVTRLVNAAMQLRDRVLPEAVLAVLALLGSQLVVWGGAESLGLVRGREQVTGSAAVWWYALVALPIYQFLVYRWLWRWLIWSRLLWGLSRLRLQPIATHPDRQGGLGFLSEPAIGFGLVILGISAVQAGVWADQIVFLGRALTSFTQQFAAAVVVAVLLALGPLLVFSRALFRARFAAVRDYGRLATDHARLFQARWIDRGPRDSVLGSPDVSSLADLGTAYDVMRSMRIVPFGAREITLIVAATAIPIIPLVLLQLPLLELLKKLGGIVVGGLPG